MSKFIVRCTEDWQIDTEYEIEADSAEEARRKAVADVGENIATHFEPVLLIDIRTEEVEEN